MMATISSDVPTGRSMKIRDGFMRLTRVPLPALPLSARASLSLPRARDAARCALADQDLGAVLQLVGAVHYHHFPGLEPLRNRHVGGVARAERHRSHVHPMVRIDDVHVGA